MSTRRREFAWWSASARWLKPCSACGTVGYLPDMPEETGYDGAPNPGGAKAAELVRSSFDPLVETNGAWLCPQCAAVIRFG